MKKINLKNYSLLMSVMLVFCQSAFSAIAIDRNRIIFHQGDGSLSLPVRNDNATKPYLAKSWLADKNDSTVAPFMAMPALQRIDPKQSSFIRIRALPSADLLPSDRESLYYFNVLEIPTVTQSTNVMQMALQTKVKFFYRPESLKDDKINFSMDKLSLLNEGAGKYKLVNASAFYINVTSITDNREVKQVKAVTLPPFSDEMFPISVNGPTAITIINDYGSKMPFDLSCSGMTCQPVLKN